MAITLEEKNLTRIQPTRKTASSVLLPIIGKCLVYIILTAGVIIFISPWLWMVSASFQPIGKIFNWPPTWIPEVFTIENYQKFLDKAGLWIWFFNSALLAVSVVLLQIFFNSMAGYAFAKRHFPGRDAIFILMLGTLMIPGSVFLIPNFLILQHIPLANGNSVLGAGGHGWLDTFWALIIPYSVSVWGIFFFRQYMKTIPDELLDAARIDGANEFWIYWKVALPLSGPAIAFNAISTFTFVWNDFFWPLIVINSPKLRTVQLGLALYVVKNRTAWAEVMAGSVLATLPVLIIFLMFQKYFIRGIALTGMK